MHIRTLPPSPRHSSNVLPPTHLIEHQRLPFDPHHILILLHQLPQHPHQPSTQGSDHTAARPRALHQLGQQAERAAQQRAACRRVAAHQIHEGLLAREEAHHVHGNH